ncbi:uncharacterized protein LOC105696568 [Orussus abietinus]|uniref:uncharacterized protein LOC105696568 n=1 Tax=Orussus abietinus TaxID=222816 RepID=UPI0006258A9F|nr:uncharacterized protein LOC105696568 [Orussus abietinus]
METIVQEVTINNPQIDNSPENLQQKEKLIADIKKLKLLAFQLECRLNINKFKDVRETLKLPAPVCNVREHAEKMANTENQLQEELYRYAGLYCESFNEKEYVFRIMSSADNAKTDTYCVQITTNNGALKVGKWCMPMSVDMDEILMETPLASFKDVKDFLRNCKRWTDCYSVRLRQFNELKSFLENIMDCTLEANLGHSEIYLQLRKIRDVKSEQDHDVIFYLCYKTDETRPCEILIDSGNINGISAEIQARLKNYFKRFHVCTLKTAFEKTINATDDEFQWNMVQENEDIAALCADEDIDSEDEFLSTIKRGKRKGGPTKLTIERKKRRHGDTANESTKTDDTLCDNSDNLDTESVKLPRRSVKSKEPRKKNAESRKGKTGVRVRKNKQKVTALDEIPESAQEDSGSASKDQNNKLKELVNNHQTTTATEKIETRLNNSECNKDNEIQKSTPIDNKKSGKLKGKIIHKDSAENTNDIFMKCSTPLRRTGFKFSFPDSNQISAIESESKQENAKPKEETEGKERKKSEIGNRGVGEVKENKKKGANAGKLRTKKKSKPDQCS